MINRREFIAGLGSAAAWPLAARAQQPDRVRLIGYISGNPEGDSADQTQIAAFRQTLQELGWTVGRNVRIDYRWGAEDAGRIRRNAAELVALSPDAILAIGDRSVGALQESTRTVPVVFTVVIDPVATGYVASLARPGGNFTGFINFEFATSGKWLELLTQIAPGVTRAAVLRDPTMVGAGGMLGAIQAVAPTLHVEVGPIDVRNADEIERAINEFARRPNGGLIVQPNGWAFFHRELIIALAAKYRLPAVYPQRVFIRDGGLVSYGPDDVDQFRRAAGYVDRILKGAKPADLPVQVPVKYEAVINMKTVKALGLTIPETLLATADEVIQ